MIGTGLKKLAIANGMTVSDGVAYGNFRGYAVTLSEGSGYKRMDIVTAFPELGQQETLLKATEAVNMEKEYRVRKFLVNKNNLTFIFHDTIGTMGKIEAFIEWFFPLLQQNGATPYNICAECGTETTGDHWYLINGVAVPMHEQCGERLQTSIQEQEQARKDEDTGSYVSGTIGAFLGAILGAAVWALVLSMGFVASIIGLLIGWLAEKGYTLLKGRRGKGKVVILILAIIFGVLLGTIVPDVVHLAGMIADGETAGYTYLDIPFMIIYLMQVEPDYLHAVLSNAGMGLLFAALGVFSLLRKTGQEVSGTKIKKLR